MYQPPSLDQIILDLRTSVQAEVGGTDPWTWPNNLTPTLKSFAQALRAGYLRLGFIHEQAFVTTARGDYLDFHGIQAGGLSRSPATYAQGPLTGSATLGAVIPDATTFTRTDGQQFQAIGTYTVKSNPFSFNVRAIDVGEMGNTDPGAKLSLLTPLTGFTTFTVGSGGIIGGAEQENDDSFRQRILFHKQNPPHGGSPAEYMEWAQTKNGVTRVFVKRATPQPGSVTVYYMKDGVGNGVPTPADVDEMRTLLYQFGPSDAEIIVAAPTPQSVDITITQLVPDTPSLREAIANELKAMFMRRAEPASVTQSFTFSRSWIDEAISHAPTWRRSVVTVPAADVVISTAGVIPTLGTITFAA